ncbi:hypothetical protein CVU75_01680 [Candidatus Dependentiae bacterium HGW-Dependentiae-1]|nr:MAG: hypothetical protein CVU75_01680 [Candidatus Dependentiae bacterium HGW-Dependentiae-1]
MKKALFFLGIIFFSAQMSAMQEAAPEVTFEEEATQIVGAGVSLVKLAGPGYIYLRTSNHEGQYANAVQVSLGSVVLWREAKRLFTKATGKAPVIPVCVLPAESTWKSWECTANSAIGLANKAIDIVGPMTLSFLVQQGLESIQQRDRAQAPAVLVPAQ